MEDAIKCALTHKVHTIAVAVKDSNYNRTTPRVLVSILDSLSLSLSHASLMCIYIYIYITAVLPEYTCSSGNGCDQQCIVVNGVDQCSCDIGYQLTGDGSTCIGLW